MKRTKVKSDNYLWMKIGIRLRMYFKQVLLQNRIVEEFIILVCNTKYYDEI